MYQTYWGTLCPCAELLPGKYSRTTSHSSLVDSQRPCVHPCYICNTLPSALTATLVSSVIYVALNLSYSLLNVSFPVRTVKETISFHLSFLLPVCLLIKYTDISSGFIFETAWYKADLFSSSVSGTYVSQLLYFLFVHLNAIQLCSN